jgi:hypothetical protein
MNKNYMYMEFSITKKDGTPVTEPANNDDDEEQFSSGPLNLLGKTFFKQVKIFLNNKLVYDSGDTYAYRVIAETELNYGEQYKKHQLEASLYEKDIPEEFDSKENTGWRSRSKWFKDGRRVECMASLHSDIFNQDKLLLSHINLRLELHRNDDSFAIQTFDGTTDYRLNIHQMIWYIRKVDLMSSLALGLESYLSKEVAKYPIRRITCKTIHIEGNRRDLTNTIISTGQIPRRIVLMMVDKKAYHGDYSLNPFNFRPFNLREAQIVAAGTTYPRNKMTFDFDNNRYVRAYMNMLEANNLASTDRDNGITYYGFKNGYCFICFDLSPDSSDGVFWELIREGSTNIRLTFDKDTPKDGIKLISICEYDNLMTIDKHRNVFLDYTA